MVHYFLTPFGVSGDRASIPEEPVDGHVNYTDGWGPDYSLNLQTNPSALAIERSKTNQIMYDITSVLQQYQQFAVPDFITADDNGGVPFPYSISARVRYDAGGGSRVYASRVDSNIELPTNTTNWNLVDDISGITGTGADVRQTSPALLGSPTAPTPIPFFRNANIANADYVNATTLGFTQNTSVRFVNFNSAYPGTYNNGSSGVGATITNSGAQVALSFGSVPAVNGDLVLLGGQDASDASLAYQNGLYSVTSIGSGASNWVLTRATIYDTVAKIYSQNNGSNASEFKLIAADGTGFADVDGIFFSNPLYPVAVIGTDPIQFSYTTNRNGFLVNNYTAGDAGKFPVVDSLGNLQMQTMTGVVGVDDAGVTDIIGPLPYGAASAFTGPPGQFDTALATKNYADTALSDQLYPVTPPLTARLFSTSNFVSNYSNGAAGVGATLTATSVGVVTLDGKAVVLNDVVVFDGQSDAKRNGKYKCTTEGTAGVAAIFTRSTDYDTPAEINGDVDSTFLNNYIYIQDGDTNEFSLVWCSTVISAIGTDDINFYQTFNINGFVPHGTANYIQGTSYTFTRKDICMAGVFTDAAGATTLTVDTEANQNWILGDEINISQSGAGQFTLTAAGGVTIHTAEAGLKSAAQYAYVKLKYFGSDIWFASGKLSS